MVLALIGYNGFFRTSDNSWLSVCMHPLITVSCVADACADQQQAITKAFTIR